MVIVIETIRRHSVADKALAKRHIQYPLGAEVVICKTYVMPCLRYEIRITVTDSRRIADIVHERIKVCDARTADAHIV